MIFQWSQRGTILMVTGAAIFGLPWFWMAVQFGWQVEDVESTQAGEFPSLMLTFIQAGVVMLLGAGIWVMGRMRTPPPVNISEKEASDIDYGRHLIGLGYAYVVLGMFNALLLGGLFYTQRLGLQGGQFVPILEGEEDASPELAAILGQRLALLVMVSLSMAVLGTLFFLQTSVRQSRKHGHLFNRSLFWTGVWFRAGEAIAFSLAFLWLSWALRPELYHWLPILSLFLGMFVITGEELVTGVAARLLAFANKMVQVPTDGKESKFAPKVGAGPQGKLASTHDPAEEEASSTPPDKTNEAGSGGAPAEAPGSAPDANSDAGPSTDAESAPDAAETEADVSAEGAPETRDPEPAASAAAKPDPSTSAPANPTAPFESTEDAPEDTPEPAPAPQPVAAGPPPVEEPEPTPTKPTKDKKKKDKSKRKKEKDKRRDRKRDKKKRKDR